jgi:hypothetical protein
MNLFRSEEHVRRWSGYDAASAEGIVSAARLHAVLFSRLGRYRERLAPDYLTRVAELSSGMVEALGEATDGSKYWRPR